MSNKEDPMKYDSDFSDILSTCKYSSDDPRLQDFIGDFGHMRGDAPYQRAYIWKLPYKIRLIKSIFFSIPIGPFHRAKIGDSLNWYVLDGKQRFGAIRAFMGQANEKDDNFSVTMKDKDGVSHRVTYLAMLAANARVKEHTHKDPGYKVSKSDKFLLELLRKFRSYRIQLVDWEDTTFEQQCAIFNAINYSKELTTDERIYCPNFLSKKVIDYIFSTSISHYLGDNLDNALLRNKRMRPIRYCHNIMMLCFGDNLNSEGVIKEVGKVRAEKSARNLHFKCVGSHIVDTRPMTDEILMKLELFESAQLLRQAAKTLRDIINFKSGLPTVKGHVVFDLIVYMIHRHQLGRLTMSECQENIEELHDVVLSFIKRKHKELAHGGTSTKKDSIEKRQHLLGEMMHERGLFQNKKNEPISEHRKTINRMESNGKCAICDRVLTRKTAQNDHVDSKNKTSNDDLSNLLCDYCNRSKGDISRKQSEQISQYFMLNSQDKERVKSEVEDAPSR